MAGGTEWSRGPTDSRTLRVLLHVAVGVPFGLGLLLVALALGPAATDPTAAGLLAGGVLLLGAVAVGARRRGRIGAAGSIPETLGAETPLSTVRPAWLLVATLGAAGVLAAASGLGVQWLLATALVGLLVPATAVGLLRTEGELDPEERSLRYGDDRVPLRSLSSIRGRIVGDSAFLWCTFVPGSERTPGLIVLPASVYRDHRTVFDAGVAASDEVLAAPDRPLRLVAYGFGSGMVLLGLLSGGVVYAGGASLVVGAFVGGSLALLGAFFLVLGRYET